MGALGSVAACERARRWPAYAAAACAFAFAGVSFYWGVGGEVGVRTLGGRIEELALARDPAILTAVWVTGVLKVVGGLLALALVQAWGRHLPTRLLLVAASGAALLLTVYGVVQVVSVGLVLSGVVTIATPEEPSVLWWRLLLWEPWFLVWGLLLGVAARDARPRVSGR